METHLLMSSVSWEGIKFNRNNFGKTDTLFEKKYKMMTYAKQVLQWFPDLKPEADKRIAEYKYYVVNMPESEIQTELYRMKLQAQSNEMFRENLTKMQEKNQDDTRKLLFEYDLMMRNMWTAPGWKWVVKEKSY